MQKKNIGSFSDLGSIGLDIEAFINVLESWAEKEMQLEVCLISQALKSKAVELNKILENESSKN